MLISVFDMYYEFSCRLPYTVASLRLSLLNPRKRRGNFRSLLLARPVCQLASYLRTSEDLSALHNCSECETLRFSLTKTLSRNTKEFEILSGTLTFVSPGTLHSSDMGPGVR